MTPLRETPPVAGQPGQLSLQNVVSILISRAGRKAMTYTDLLGIGGLIDLLSKYVDTLCLMVTWFLTFDLMTVTLVLGRKSQFAVTVRV